MLHGLADSIEGYRWLPDMLRLDWLNYLLVNAPDEYYGGYSWYDFAGDPVPGVARSCKLLSDLLDDTGIKGFPSDQTILGGFSQGCLMSLETGLRCPQRLAGIIGISGYICDPAKLIRELSPVAKQQRVLMTHGTQDPIIPMQLAERSQQALRKHGYEVEWHSYPMPHAVCGEEVEALGAFLASAFGESEAKPRSSSILLPGR